MPEHAQLRAWRVNEYEWYAAYSLDHAIELAMEMTGEARDQIFDADYGDPEPDTTEIWFDDTRSHKITVRQLLDDMEGPGFAFGTEC